MLFHLIVTQPPGDSLSHHATAQMGVLRLKTPLEGTGGTKGEARIPTWIIYF